MMNLKMTVVMGLAITLCACSDKAQPPKAEQPPPAQAQAAASADASTPSAQAPTRNKGGRMQLEAVPASKFHEKPKPAATPGDDESKSGSR